METGKKKTMLISIAGYDREETMMAADLARQAEAHFDVLVMSYGGVCEHLLEEKGISVLRVGSEPGREQAQQE